MTTWQPSCNLSREDMIDRVVIGGGPLAEKKHNDNAIHKIFDDLKASCNYMSYMFNGVLSTGNACKSIIFDTSKIKKSIYPLIEEKLSLVTAGKFKGILTREHIATISQFFYCWFTSDKRNLYILGSEQSGKTIVYCAIVMIMPVLEWILRKRKIIPVILSANRNNITSSVKKELEVLLTLYGNVDLVIDGNRISLNHLKKNILDDFVSKKYDGKTLQWDALIFNREPHSFKRYINNFVSKTNEEIQIVQIIDEVQNGSDVRGRTEKLYREIEKLNIQQKVKIAS